MQEKGEGCQEIKGTDDYRFKSSIICRCAGLRTTRKEVSADLIVSRRQNPNFYNPRGEKDPIYDLVNWRYFIR